MSENNAPMKMKLMHLIIETNRQCNLNCTLYAWRCTGFNYHS